MSLTFLTPLMLAGAALIAAPIILHLVMRQQPKHLLFPALRFVQLRNDKNKRSLKLRHLLLLLLRCGAIVFLALAMARPTLQSAGLLGDQEAPIAAALVIDTSPRMQYKQQNQTRVEVAQDVANRVITQLPPESEVAVLDSRTTNPAFSIDVAVARQRVSRLKPAAAVRPLAELCADALRMVSENSKARKEIYIFTDLSRTAWTGEAVNQLRKRLEAKPEVACYVIDVGVIEPKNISLGDLRLSAESIAKNTPLRIDDTLIDSSVGGDQTVALELVDVAGQPQRRGQATVKATSGAQQPVELPELLGLEQGTHQGVVKIVGEDGLPADDARFFTVEVRTPWKVLVAAPQPVNERAVFLAEYISPTPHRKSGQAKFECEVVPFDELPKRTLDDYAAVYLLDPPPLGDAVWQSLLGYTERGGGVGVFLGRNAQPKGRPVDDFNTAAALQLMPGKLSRQWHRQDAFLAPSNYEHPLLSIFRSATGGVPWADLPVSSHWQLSEPPRGVETVVPFSNGEAAVLERNIGKGRVVVMTTPLSDPLSNDRSQTSQTDEPWNSLTYGEWWPTAMLVNGISFYLVGSGEERFNYQAGETVVLRLPEEHRQLIFSLRTPEGEELPQSIDQKAGTITITTTSALGNYLLRAGGSEKGVRRGFSVNVPAAETDLTRLAREEFGELLGKDRFKLSRGREEIERDVSAGRTGREMYPLLILLVAVALGLESVLANKFYRRDTNADLKEDAKRAAADANATLPPVTKAPEQREAAAV